MKKKTPISLLEDSFLSFKEYLENELGTTKLVFDQDFVAKLYQETSQLLRFCQVLNQNTEIIAALNKAVDPNNSLPTFYKAEHFVLSECIAWYQQNTSDNPDRTAFVLAYYNDVLKQGHFADAKAIQTLNKLAVSPEFKKHLNSILTTHKLQMPKGLLFQILEKYQTQSVSIYKNHLEAFVRLGWGDNSPEVSQIAQIASESKNNESSQNSNVTFPPSEDTLEKALQELHALTGIATVKKDIQELINLLEIQKKRSQQGLMNVDISLHTVFLGPPGTGKTSVARLLSRIFKHLGFLSKGQVFETDREGMVAGYVGQTALKVDQAVEESLGGVLFIDEAYALTTSGFGTDYGTEAVNTILKRMEDYRDDLAVVVAGYTEPMKLFVESNPGLRSRFNRYFVFEHFKPEELYQIFEGFCAKSDFVLTPEASEKLKDTFELLYEAKDDSFGNARVVRNLFEKCVQNQANRMVSLTEWNAEILKTLEEADIPEPKETQKNIFLTTNTNTE